MRRRVLEPGCFLWMSLTLSVAVAALPAAAQDDEFEEDDDITDDGGDDALADDAGAEDEASDDIGDALDEGDGEGAIEKKEEVDPEIPEGGETVGESLGGATNFVFPTGFYISSDLGGFVRFGGYGDATGEGACFRCVPRLTSDFQPWVGVNIGYDIIPNFGVEATLGTGFIGNAAPRGYSQPNLETAPPDLANARGVVVPEHMAITMLNVALTGSWYFLDRLAIQGKVFVGGAFLTPDPDPARLNFVRGLTCDAGFWGAPSPDQTCGGEFSGDFGALGGFGLGLRYATLLPGMVIGFDVNSYAVWSMNVATAHTGGVSAFGTYLPPPIPLGFALPIIPAVSFAPVIKYVF